MARLSKAQLLARVEESIRESGWGFLYLGEPGSHPARYQVYQNGKGVRVRVYIWNLSHGGGAARPAHEYRIQITGISNASGTQQFQPEVGGKTLILGWWEETGVFAGFDYLHHAAPLGASPSIQIGEEALQAAHANGFTPYNKGNGELAIAFRPDFLGTYIENLEALHQAGQSASEIEILDRIADDPEDVEDSSIEDNVPKERQYAVVSTRRALREINFRERVLTAYGHRCAMCGIQLKLLDAAHILPVAHPDSTDETGNGVALCALHHRAYDRAFVTFDGKYKVFYDTHMAKQFKAAGHDGGLDRFTTSLRPLLILPPDKKDRPSAKFIEAANTMRGWA